jgi:Ca2+-transporting ATPase
VINTNIPTNITGLSDAEVLLAREEYGQNKLNCKKENGFFNALMSILKEHMVLLLLIASIIYFVSGKTLFVGFQ